MALFGFRKKKAEQCLFKATQNGRVIRLSEVGDGVFSEKMLGDGFAVEPAADEVYAPVSGSISRVFDTGHAYGITADNGLEVLVHIGLDTVSLKGEGFKSCVREGDSVRAGDKIAEADISFIRSKGFNPVTMVIVTNMESVRSTEVRTGPVTGGSDTAMSCDVL